VGVFYEPDKSELQSKARLSGCWGPKLNSSNKIWRKLCSRSLLVYLFNRFAYISYGRFIALPYKYKLPTYVQEPLVMGRRGCVQGEI